MERGANFSADRMYRYVLWRTWEVAKGHVMFAGLNCSRANEYEDDPTVRRMMGFARDWGYGGVFVLNINAYVATDPRDMMAAADPVGPHNDEYLLMYAASSERRIMAWGIHGAFQGRGEAVLNLLADYPLECLGLTQAGHPRHPLYLKKTQSLFPIER